ncbi:MAG: hypothetical protein D6696_19610 [Acidobacteria bacterium]|nr:MAG: hypothetical protein D6696_19610 [Acidobacteriota bacterium]
MSWKLVVVGGIVFWLVTFVVSFATGAVIHEGVLKPHYDAHKEFWRPALVQDPPDMAALMPYWIAVGVLTGLVLAAIYGCVRPAFPGPGWKRGLYYGLILSGIYLVFILGWSGVFNLPNAIWFWWAVEPFLYFLPAGAVLGWLGEKLAPAGPAGA